jgi:TonB family protein
MKKMFASIAVILVLAAFVPIAARGEDGAGQSARPTASTFTLNMRILEGSRDAAAEPAKPVTSSFLKYTNLVNVETERDIQVEQQIKKLYNLKDVGLLTEATLSWVKGKAGKAFHMFRLNGQEYLVMVTPGGSAERNRFRIEVYEQGAEKKSSLLDTEFSLPDKNSAVFGFETTALKPYFISLRVEHWSDDPSVAGGGIVRPVVMPATGQRPAGQGQVKPPKLVRDVKPVYPKEAAKAGIQGVVILEATTDTYGRVANVKVLRGIPLLDQAAVDALKQWVYEPMVIDGKPHPVVFTVTMRFNLDEEKKSVVGGVAGGVRGGVQGGVESGVEGGVQGGVEGGVVGGVVGGVPGAPSDKPFDGDAVRAVGKVQPPKIVKMVQPVYPEIARQGRVEGVVILEAKTDEEGNVVDARILRSIKVLDQAALDAVKQWKYEPLVIDGKAHKVVFTVTVRFVLDEGIKKDVIKKFAAGAVRAEGEVEPPRLIKEVAAVYPEIARQARVQGVVILAVKTDETGKVVDTVVLRSIPLLDQAAIDAVRQWVYEPFVQDGKAVPVVFNVTVRFQLE